MKHDSALYVIDSCRGREYNEDCPAGQRCNILPCFDCHIVPDHGYCCMYFFATFN